MTAPLFPPDVVAAVCRHMNDDHPDDALLICRTLGGQPGAEWVATVGLDGEAMHFTAEVDGSSVPVSVRFASPVRERPDVRLAVVRLYEMACHAAGLAPRPH